MNAFKKINYNSIIYSYINLHKQQVTSVTFKNNQLITLEIEDYFDFDWGEPIEDLEFNTKLEEAKKQIQNIEL